MKRRVVKSTVSMLLASAMVATTLAGCGSTTETTETTTGSDAASTEVAQAEPAETEAAGSYTDYTGGFQEQVTIQIPVYDRAFEGWNVTDNYYTKWIQSEFGDKYNVKVEFVAIGRSTEVQDYMQMIAAGNAPDIIMNYDMPKAVNYYNEGAIADLDLEEIAYYAPDYYSAMSETIGKYGQLDGANAFFFAEREAIYYNWVNLIRKDWLDQVNMEVPTNLDELNAVAAAWKEAGLGTLGGSLVQTSFTYQYPFMTNSMDAYQTNLDLSVAPLTLTASKDYLLNLNKQYNDGLIDQEFYLKTDDAATKADFIAGKTGTYSFYMNSATDVFTSLLANNPDAVVASVSGSAGSPDGKGYYYEYPEYGMIMGINSTCTPEERAAVWMYLNWMIQDENLLFLQNGVEGESYNLNESGIPVRVADFAGESKTSQNGNKDYWCLVQEIIDYGDEAKTLEANKMLLAPEGYDFLIQDAYDQWTANKDYGIVTPIFTKSVETVAEYSADLQAMWLEFYVDLATCDPAEFEAKYTEYSQEYLDAGFQEILDEKQALIDEGSFIAE